jgi:hypothetical protein
MNLSDSDMMALRETKKRGETWERHWQTLMLAVVTAALAFSAKFMWEVNTQMTKNAAEQQADRQRFNDAITRFDSTLIVIQSGYVTQRQFEGYMERLRAVEASVQKR